MCTVLLSPGVNPFAVHKYIISNWTACAAVPVGPLCSTVLYCPVQISGLFYSALVWFSLNLLLSSGHCFMFIFMFMFILI